MEHNGYFILFFICVIIQGLRMQLHVQVPAKRTTLIGRPNLSFSLNFFLPFFLLGVTFIERECKFHVRGYTYKLNSIYFYLFLLFTRQKTDRLLGTIYISHFSIYYFIQIFFSQHRCINKKLT